MTFDIFDHVLVFPHYVGHIRVGLLSQIEMTLRLVFKWAYR